MEHFDNILYISLLQILPSSIIFFIIWNIITNHFYKSVFATLGFSTWIIFNSICLRKTRYRANHLVICGNYINRDNHIHTESNIIINTDIDESISHIKFYMCQYYSHLVDILYFVKKTLYFFFLFIDFYF